MLAVLPIMLPGWAACVRAYRTYVVRTVAGSVKRGLLTWRQTSFACLPPPPFSPEGNRGFLRRRFFSEGHRYNNRKRFWTELGAFPVTFYRYKAVGWGLSRLSGGSPAATSGGGI